MNKYIFLTVTACAAIGAAWTGCGGSSTTGGTGGAGGKPTSSTSKMSTTKASSTTGVSTGPGGVGGGSGIGGAGGGAPVGIKCNPVTNQGCASGEACDIAVDQSTGMVTGFACYPPPNDAAVCATCNAGSANGPFCAGGATCFNVTQTMSECARYCCSDADCGADGACDVKDMLFAPASTTLGICIAKPSTGTGGSASSSSSGTGGTGGSASSSSSSGSASSSTTGSSTTGSGTGGSGTGGGAGSVAFACNPPATAPSNGSCVTIGM